MMTDKEKITREYLELTAKFFEDSENVVFCRDLDKTYEVMIKGDEKKIVEMTLEICKCVIQKTEIPADLFKYLLDLSMEQKAKKISISELFKESE
jgi:hypothetical protein